MSKLWSDTEAIRTSDCFDVTFFCALAINYQESLGGYDTMVSTMVLENVTTKATQLTAAFHILIYNAMLGKSFFFFTPYN